MVPCTSRSASIVPYIPRIGAISPSWSGCTTHHPHALRQPESPHNEPLVLTRSRKPSNGMLQLLCFSDSHLSTANGFLVQVLRLKTMWSLSHFHSSFEVLTHCSDFLKLFGFWFPTFLDEHWYSLSFSVPRSVLQSRFFRANHPMSYFLCCTPSHFRDEFSSSIHASDTDSGSSASLCCVIPTVVHLSHSYCTFVTTLLLPFVDLFFNLPVREWALCAEFTARFEHTQLTFGKMPTVIRKFSASTFQEVFARLSVGLPRLASASATLFFSTHFYLLVLVAPRMERLLVSILHDHDCRVGNCIGLLSNTDLLVFTDSKILFLFQYHLIPCDW